MKKELAAKMQELFKWVTLNSVGKSAPLGIYEKEIPDEIKREVLRCKG